MFVLLSGQHGSSHSEDGMCQGWKKMLKYRYLLTTTATSENPLQSHTAQRVLPPSDMLHTFVVSSSGVVFQKRSPMYNNVTARAYVSIRTRARVE